jgi:hypothetical protein
MNYIWDVVNMERKSNSGFVVTVHYTVNATDGQFSASTYGSIGYSEKSPFVPYAQLNKAQVISWVQASLGKDAVEKDLAGQIAAQKAPKQISGTPW